MCVCVCVCVCVCLMRVSRAFQAPDYFLGCVRDAFIQLVVVIVDCNLFFWNHLLETFFACNCCNETFHMYNCRYDKYKTIAYLYVNA